MKRHGKQKRKLNEYKRYYKKKIEDDNKENSSDNKEDENNENENKENIKEKKKKGKKNKNKKKDIKNDSILVTSKESCNLIKKIMTEGEGEGGKIEVNNDNLNNSGVDNYKNNERNEINDNISNNEEKKDESKKKNNKNKKKESEKNNNGDNDEDEKNDNKNNSKEKNKKIKDNKNDKDNNNEDDDATHKNNEESNNGNNSNVSDKSKSKNIDNFLLSSLYDLFEGYDEIIIKPNNENQYVIKGCLKIDEDKEIKFEINYDKERDFFDYYPNNTNFIFENEDEPFNWDLDIPKEDFTLLIKNFKKYKNK